MGDAPLYNGYWLPPDLSTHGYQIDRLIVILHWFMLVLFVGWGIYMIFCLWRFRARPGHKSERTGHFKLPTYIEVGVLGFEICLLVFLSYPLWAKVKNDFPDPASALNVRIIAEQFAWNIHYPGKDGVFGKTSPGLIDTVDNPIGLDRENDPNAKDDIVVVNEFHMPMNKPVIANLLSKDVIHSFWIPVLRVKQDTIPGMEIPVWFEATRTGEFDISCAQLCGVGHTTMRGRVTIQTQEEFQQWLDERSAELSAE